MNSNVNIDPRRCSNLVELLQQRASQQPTNLAYTFLTDGEVKEISLTYQQLDQQAKVIAARIRQQQAMGDRAILLYLPGLDFITAFFGCLYAGVIAVPINPPRRNEETSKLERILTDAETNLVLTTTSLWAVQEHQFRQHPKLSTIQWLTTDNLSIALADSWQKQCIDSQTIAFLQYTSGSISTPKGVILTHGNLLANQHIIKTAFGHTDTVLVVGWLPLFHDMGLIGNMLQPLYLGTRCIFMSPVHFLQKPFRWLQAISHFRATTSGGPNFAYDLCMRKITPDQRQNLDLSSWDLAFIGAEPIRSETLQQFATLFAPCGFRQEAFYPCYGLAEATLFVTGGFKDRFPTINRVDSTALTENYAVPALDKQQREHEFVGCGQPWSDTDVKIVDPNSHMPCQNGQVGEIWVSGYSIAVGYWGRTEQTAQVFQAYIADSKTGPFLRTGDLGFWQHGELFVTGRLKDIIIIRGRNYYPQDIELTATESHPALKKDCGIAFTVERKGIERLVLVHEVERSYLRKLNIKEVIANIRRHVVTEHALQVHTAILIEPGSIPRTSSGKLRRQICRAEFIAGSLRVIPDRDNESHNHKK
jgi:acyl-CoA synthetase (AMP-forming)/AMP-acid ligase II